MLVVLQPLSLVLRFDARGRCNEVEARVWDDSEQVPVFLFRGRVVNDISEAAALPLFHSLSGHSVDWFTGRRDFPLVGVRYVKWEESDDYLFGICVYPPRRYRWL